MEEEYETLSPRQYRVLTILPIPAALLSIVGSGAIIYMVARSRRQREWTPYKRLLFGMSICDIVLSINLAIGNFMRPGPTSPRVWAVGNEATCTASGFLGQLSLSAILYNGMLSFYFLLSARFGWKNRRIAKWVEPSMHIICIGYPLVTAAVGAGMGVFSEPVMGLGCQINDYPRNCGDGPGSTGETCLSILIAWVFVGIPRILNGFVIVLNNLVICVFVWRQARPSKKRGITKNNSGKSAENTASDDTSSQCNVEHSGSPNTQPKKSENMIVALSEDDPHEEPQETSPIQHKKSTRSTRDSFENDRVSMNAEKSTRSLKPSKRKIPNSKKAVKLSSVEEDQLRRLQLVRSQAILFVGSYFVSNFWVGLTSFLESISPTDADEYAMAAACYPVLVVYAIFVPLQGFFNMLVYMRPKYAKYRTHFPEEPRLWAFWLTLTGEDAPRLRNKKEESVDPYSAQNLTKAGDATPLAENKGEQLLARQDQPSQLETPTSPTENFRVASLPVHSETVWTKDEYSPVKELDQDCLARVEEGTGKDIVWEPNQKARRHVSSLKSSSLEVISEVSEMSFDHHEDDRWNNGSKLSNCSPVPLTIPERAESSAEPGNDPGESLKCIPSLPGPPPRSSMDSPILCPKRRLSPEIPFSSPHL